MAVSALGARHRPSALCLTNYAISAIRLGIFSKCEETNCEPPQPPPRHASWCISSGFPLICLGHLPAPLAQYHTNQHLCHETIILICTSCSLCRVYLETEAYCMCQVSLTLSRDSGRRWLVRHARTECCRVITDPCNAVVLHGNVVK